MEPLPATEQPISLTSHWRGPQAQPLEIDVGCHKGLFLAEMAQLYPRHNFLGIEQQAERVEKTGKKIGRMGLTNAQVVCGEGLETLKALESACATYIHVLFPDPWPKRKHHARRMVQASFLSVCARLLKPGGQLRLVTDDQDYAGAIKIHASGSADFVPVEDDREYPMTEFQKKFLEDKRPVYKLILRRV